MSRSPASPLVPNLLGSSDAERSFWNKLTNLRAGALQAFKPLQLKSEQERRALLAPVLGSPSTPGAAWFDVPRDASMLELCEGAAQRLRCVDALLQALDGLPADAALRPCVEQARTLAREAAAMQAAMRSGVLSFNADAGHVGGAA